MTVWPAPFSIRHMQSSDIDAVLDIDKLSFPTPTKREIFEYELHENKLAEYHCLLEGEQIVGYDGFWIIGDEMHISTIAVHPNWLGKGLGSLLLINMLSIAQQCPITMVTLEVRQTNHRAQSLYAKYQFEKVGVRRKYYRDTNEDAVLMTLTPLDAPFTNFIGKCKEELFARLIE